MNTPTNKPRISLWSNGTEHPCTVIYIGRRWICRLQPSGKLIFPRYVRAWVSIAPPIGGASILTTRASGWARIAHYLTGGEPLILGTPCDPPAGATA